MNRDPRYWQQRYRNEVPIIFPGAQSDANVSLEGGPASQRGDWQENMGNAASVGAGNYAAKFSFSLSTANCGGTSQPDFVAYSTGLEGSNTQASIVAYDNLYSGCGGTVPATYWAYNTGGQILTSPGYSGDGKQLAFVQTDAALEGNLVLLKWAASTTESVGSPATLTSVSAAAYAACPSPPCMTTFLLTNASGTPADNRTSSVFYDYIDDIAWVGDSHGWLHKFTPVFNGTPAEVRIGGWPVQVNTGNSLSDPVHDSLSGNVFVGDAGGYLYRVSPTGAVTTSGQLDFATGIVQGPVVDSSAGLVYVFASSDNTTSCAGGANCAAVYQLSNTFIAGNTGTEVQVGTSSGTPSSMYIGGFDSAYQNSNDSTGSLYVCGNTGANPTLYRIPIQLGILGTPAAVAGLTPAAKTSPCSPVTDVFNPNSSGGASERLFFGVQNFAHPTLCASKGCALSFVDMPWQASTSYQVGQEILVLKTVTNALYVDVAIAAGTSGATPPTWPSAVGSVTVDGGVTWFNQGPTTVAALANWTATHFYALRTRIVDSNGNVEIVSTAGTSGSPTHPTWKTTAGATTKDGSVTWTNAGVLPSAALPSAGGTSGFIFDNTVQSLAGASQVYFSTLSNQTCTTSGTTGGCAVQASQSALK